MNLIELVEHFRDLASDTEQPFLWSDAEVYRYADQAQTTFVKAIDGLRDYTSALTQLTLAANQNWVDLDPRILRVLKARDPLRGPIDVLNRTDYRADAREVPGPVKYLFIGEGEDMMRPAPVPTADTAITLVVNRLPLKTIVDGESKLEVRPDHVPYLVYGMLEQAFLKDDPDTYQPGRSEKHGAHFAALGAKAKSEMNARNRVAHPVAYGGL